MKKNKFLLNQYFLGFLIFFLFLLDRISKYLAFYKLHKHGIYFFKFASIRLEMNSGIAFGIFLPRALIIFLTGSIILFLFYFFLNILKLKQYSKAFFLSLIIFGAFSNLLDRIYYHKVIDFISLAYFPVFNLADTYISIGILSLLILSFREKH